MSRTTIAVQASASLLGVIAALTSLSLAPGSQVAATSETPGAKVVSDPFGAGIAGKISAGVDAAAIPSVAATFTRVPAVPVPMLTERDLVPVASTLR